MAAAAGLMPRRSREGHWINLASGGTEQVKVEREKGPSSAESEDDTVRVSECVGLYQGQHDKGEGDTTDTVPSKEYTSSELGPLAEATQTNSES